MTSKPETLSAQHIQASPSYHLFTTVIIIAWSVFIVVTLVILELTHHATWDYDRIAARKPLPWVFSVLPGVLRTIFDQVHGPITAMHFARLAVGSLDVPWASANTWMEVFWLADRRWSGPVGLTKAFWTLISRKRKNLHGPRIAISFWFFAAISVTALVTPVALSRAYDLASSNVQRPIASAKVSMVDLSILGGLTDSVQTTWGDQIMDRGVAPTSQFPDNMYAEIGVSKSSIRGSWFITGNANKTNMALVGVRVAGGCESLKSELTFQDLCASTFDSDKSVKVNLTTPVFEAVIICSNISITAEFGREPSSHASALFHVNTGMNMRGPEVSVFRCNVTAGVGTASVDGRNMRFSNFSHTAQSEYRSRNQQNGSLDPLAAVMRSSFAWIYSSISSKMTRSYMEISVDQEEPEWEMEIMWDSIIAMSVSIWVTSAASFTLSGVRSFPETGLQRNNTYVCALVALLGIWFVGVFGSSVVLLRSSWASSLDVYATARLLQQQPVLAGTQDAWLAELEDNEDMLQKFQMHDWRSLDS